MAKMDEGELKALLQAEIAAATLYQKQELSDKRAKAIEYYQGVMEAIPAMAGRSKVTSRDVADTLTWILPGIMRVFSASDQMAVFEPERESDEEGAKQATDYLGYLFWKDNSGYTVLRDATHDALLQGNGVIKVFWDDKEDCAYSEHTRLTTDQISLLTNDEGVEVISAKNNDEPDTVQEMDPQTGQPVEMQIPTYDLKIKRVNRRGRLVFQCIKPEDFLMDMDAVCIEDARFSCHREMLSRSELIKMGFDREDVEAIAGNQAYNFSQESLARNEVAMSYAHAAHKSMELIELFECYLKVDIDDDGIAETVLAYMAGAQGGQADLLEWSVCDTEHPFHDIPCEPVPHRWDARSIADKTMDIQDIKTVLQRQALDNIYAANLPQRLVKGKITNPDELYSPTFGGVVFGDQNTLIEPLAVPFVAGHAFDALQYFDSVIEKRTGVSKTMMALDPEALQNQTATANQNSRDAAYSQIELIARDQAENWQKVFRHALRLVVKHQDRPKTIRLRDKWVEMDPRYWNANMDVTVNVGLGTGSRDRDMLMLQSVLQNQNMLVQQFLAGGFHDLALDMLPKILTTMRKIAESAGIRSVDAYYPEIDENAVAAMKQQAAQMSQQPSMEEKKLQAQMQLEQMKMQAAVSKETAQMQADLQVKQAEQDKNMHVEAQALAYDSQKHLADMQFKYADLAQQAQIEMQKLAAQVLTAQMSGASANGSAPPVQDETQTIDAIRALAESMAQMMAAHSAPRVVTTPEGRQFTMHSMPQPMQ